ncbi:MAG: hypothetical protein KDB86_00980 [Actinobacteria bacterium]|nr:hypothetical protein [Actinomycetota bacterium]
MAFERFFSRSKSSTADRPIGMGDEDGEYEAGEGGPSFFKQEMAEWRWAAQQEAVNTINQGVDPERWANGRMAFEFERALAHGHEGLRDRLANLVGKRLHDEAMQLFELAGDVAVARDELREVDRQLVEVTRDWRTKRAEVTDDELELSRYYRLNSPASVMIKMSIAVLFVISEFLISGLVFERIFEDLPPGLGYVLALGVTVALIVVPHYVALALKEGFTQYHVHEQEALQESGTSVPAPVKRAVHVEERDDKGFRITALLVGMGLLVLILPLSWLRTNNDQSDTVNWGAFLFLLLLQLVLSGYFFLREWLDHGHPSHSLHMLDQQKHRLEVTRRNVLESLGDAVAAFHEAAEDVVLTIQQSPRWDSHIVETYYETLHYHRHLIALGLPEFEEFITWARVPYLGSAATAAESGYPLDPVSEEHRSLEEDGPLGREWLLRTSAEDLKAKTDGVVNGAVPVPAVGWLITKSPEALLSAYLGRYFDLDMAYRRPHALDDAGEDAPAATTRQSRGRKTGGETIDKRFQVVGSEGASSEEPQPTSNGRVP